MGLKIMDLFNYDWKNQEYWSLKKYAPRPEQKQIIDEIQEAMSLGFQNIILEAGTGIGKSAIATSIAKMVEDSYILTMTNQLQSQYLDDFKSMLTEMKGRSNYHCNYKGTCEDCYMEEVNQKKCTDCEYILALQQALRSPHIITNYDFLYYAGYYAGLFTPRNILILDETHNFEKKMMQLVTYTLNRKTITKRYGIDIFEKVMNGDTLKSVQSKEYWINISKRLIEMARTKKPANIKEKKRYEKEIKKYENLITILTNEDWIIETPSKQLIKKDTDFKAGLKAEFKPLLIKDYTESLLQFGETRLFLTGTLGNKDKFCRWIGIDPDETYYIYVKSPFPVEHRRIVKEYVGSMSGKKGNGKPNWTNPRALDKINEIISKHSTEKGVIHTSSNQQAWWIKKNLPNKKLWVAQGKTRAETIHQFEDSNQPIILIGAGLKDGVDFKGDKCRYQILFKMPKPSIASKQTIIRMKTDPVWYAYQTIMPLMQAYGRGIRDMDDYCVTYVLDSEFDNLLSQYKYLFNEYFLEAIVHPRKPVPKRKVAVGGK